MLSRPRLLATLPALLVAVAPPAAGAAELHAAPAGGAGPACTNPATPCTVKAALLAARRSTGADTVHLAAGTYPEVLSAANEADTDLTLSGAGIGATVLAGGAADEPVVQLGSGGGTMTVEDLTIDGGRASPLSPALRSRLTRLAVRRVRIVQTGAAPGTPKLAPAIDADAADAELTLDRVAVLADTQTADAAVGAVNTGGSLVVRDSTIAHTATGASAALYARGPTTIQRSTITHGEADAGYPVRVVNAADALAVAVDSSVLQGGTGALRLDVGLPAAQLAVRGSTLVPAAAATRYAVELSSSVAGSTALATIDSSILLNRSVRIVNGTKATCTFTNLPATGASGAPNCPTTGAANATAKNTKLTAAELLLDGGLTPGAGSPAIDSGNPAGLAAGESAADRLGRQRAAASDDRCDAGPGVRDKGAFERYRPTPTVAIAGPAAVAAGATATFAASTTALDPAYAWTFADGASGGAGATTSHAFAVGASSVRLAVTDRASNCSASAALAVTAAPGATAAQDHTRPVLSRLKLGTKSLRRGAARFKLTFRLSEAARVQITVGRRSGRKVVARRRVTVQARQGANTVTLTRKRLRLRRGSYAITLSARDAAGNASKTSKPLALRVR